MIEQRDLLLVPFPFSDQSGLKVRPVVVVSNNHFNRHSEDLIVAGVTSNVSKDRYSVLLLSEDLDEGKLSSLCSVKAENILKMDRGLVIRKIGKINKGKLGEIVGILSEIIKPE